VAGAVSEAAIAAGAGAGADAGAGAGAGAGARTTGAGAGGGGVATMRGGGAGVTGGRGGEDCAGEIPISVAPAGFARGGAGVPAGGVKRGRGGPPTVLEADGAATGGAGVDPATGRTVGAKSITGCSRSAMVSRGLKGGGGGFDRTVTGFGIVASAESGGCGTAATGAGGRDAVIARSSLEGDCGRTSPRASTRRARP